MSERKTEGASNNSLDLVETFYVSSSEKVHVLSGQNNCVLMRALRETMLFPFHVTTGHGIMRIEAKF